LPIKQAATLTVELAAKIEQGGYFKFNGVAVKMPEQCHFVMRYE
jgi:hypothetical protein